MKKIIKLSCCFVLLLCLGCTPKSHLDPDNPVTVHLWNYYTGKQMESFNALVDTFNTGVGKEKDIVVEVTSVGNVNDLGKNVLDAANKKVGSSEMPDIFAAYADTAYQIDQLGKVVDLSDYFSKDELAEYVDGYIDEGHFNDGLKIFPVAKSTEIMMINTTDFEPFAKAKGVTLDDLQTIEGLNEVAKKYYEYTNGKAFFGRDALANYMIIGLKEFGHDIVSVKDDQVVFDFDKTIVRKLWDNYYLPYIHGYYKAEGRFRSDDVKMGNIISFVGSSSGATFFPKKVIINDEKSYPVDVKVLKAPTFKDGQAYAVQQGAGFVVTKGDDAHIEGSIEFLKWFTDVNQNIKFSIDSGYLPVKKAANNMDSIEKNTKIESELMKEVIQVSVDTVNESKLYTTKAIPNGTSFRSKLESSLKDKSEKDRQAIAKSLKNGQNEKAVFEKYENDQNFETWYQETYQALKEIITNE